MDEGAMEEGNMGKTGLPRRQFLKTAALTGAAMGALAVGRGADEAGAARRRTSSAARVPRKELGTTGATVPIIQLGTSQRLDQTYDRVMHRVFKHGVDAFDTALSYGWGSSHRAIATFIGQMGDRKKLWLTSKSNAWSVGGLVKDADKALDTLETDYLDLYLLHSVDSLDMLAPEFLKAGERLRKSGKTRFFGFSCHDGRVVRLMNYAAKVGGIDAILFRYNFRRYGDLELNRAIDRCKKAGIGLVAMKTNGAVPARAEKVVAFRSRNFTLGQAKLKSVWADERIDSVLSEMDSLRVAKENIAAAKSGASLTAGEVHQLNRLAALTAHLACNGCAHLCEAAAGGRLAIADPLRFLSYHEAYGDTERARRLYNALPKNRLDVGGASLTAAMAACPQGINIAGRLAQARRALLAQG